MLIRRCAIHPIASLTVSMLAAGCGSSSAPADPAPPATNQHAEPGSAPEPGTPARNMPRAVPGEIFTDITEAVGLDFTHRAAEDGNYLLPVIMSGGASVFDANGDGLLDIYFVNAGNALPIHEAPGTVGNVYYQQQPDGTFLDRTAQAGLGDTGYGMGCTAGDLDNDGDVDLVVSNWGRNTILRNEGDGTYTDVTEYTGLTEAALSISAALLDYNNDGLLDIYVANYVIVDEEEVCHDRTGRRDYCSPKAFHGAPDRLYRNEGNWQFRDVSQHTGVGAIARAGLGVVAADFTDDGLIDIYVANDGEDNVLWINQHDGPFQNQAYALGAAVNRNGETEASMGIALGDVSSDGLLDLLITHLVNESNTLYVGRGPHIGFDDVTPSSNLVVPSLPSTGFGTLLFDVDHDAMLDLAVVNGAVTRRATRYTNAPPFWCDYAEPNQLFRNIGGGNFEDISDRTGAYHGEIEVSRGLIGADFDRDGDIDLLVTNLEGPARLFRNNLDLSARETSWLTVRPMLADEQRDAIGAMVTVRTPSRALTQPMSPSVGYATCTLAPLHFGLGGDDTVDAIEVTWPDGTTETFPGGRARRHVTVTKGEGTRDAATRLGERTGGR